MKSIVRHPDVILEMLKCLDNKIENADAHSQKVPKELYEQQTALENELDFAVDWYNKQKQQPK